MLARKKSSRYIRYKFTLNWKILALLLLMRKFTQFQKNIKKYLFVMYDPAVEYWVRILEIAKTIPICAR